VGEASAELLAVVKKWRHERVDGKIRDETAIKGIRIPK